MPAKTKFVFTKQPTETVSAALRRFVRAYPQVTPKEALPFLQKQMPSVTSQWISNARSQVRCEGEAVPNLHPTHRAKAAAAPKPTPKPPAVEPPAKPAASPAPAAMAWECSEFKLPIPTQHAPEESAPRLLGFLPDDLAALTRLFDRYGREQLLEAVALVGLIREQKHPDVAGHVVISYTRPKAPAGAQAPPASHSETSSDHVADA